MTTEDQLNAIRWDLDGKRRVDAQAANATRLRRRLPDPRARGWAAPPRDALATNSRQNISLTSSTSPGWEPIGNCTTNFTATFDGNAPDYIIDSLFINRTATDYVGLFGVTGTARSRSGLM